MSGKTRAVIPSCSNTYQSM